MAALVHPLNALHSHALAAAAALAIGGGVVAGAYFAFDVAGVRDFAAKLGARFRKRQPAYRVEQALGGVENRG